VSGKPFVAAPPAGAEPYRLSALARARRSRRPGGWRAPGVDLGQVAVVIRWAALVLVLLDLLATGRPSREELVAGPILVVVAVIATVGPSRLLERRAPGRALLVHRVGIAADAAVTVTLVVWTGGWASPYLLSLGAVLLVAGLGGGLGAASLSGGVAAAGLLAGGALGSEPAASGVTVTQRVVSLALVAVVGVYGRWVVRRTADEHAAELARQQSAAEANALLLELHAMAANQPAWLSLRAALQSTVASLRHALDPDVVVVLLREPSVEGSGGAAPPEGGDVVLGSGWQVAVAEGVVLAETLQEEQLPAVLRRALGGRESTHVRALGPGEGIGAASGEALYVPMRARGELVGLIGVERRAGRPPADPASRRAVERLAEHAGLAIDNARWFRRLRSLGAQEERARIARELHDRFGQSLAAVGLRLDGLAAGAGSAGGGDVSLELHQLAGEVRMLTRQLREKLSDLRAETSERAGVHATLAAFLRRVALRSGVVTQLSGEEAHRLPPTIEREVWRIAQEAILNAERHAGATTIAVEWAVASGRARLEVADDGCGLPASAPLRADAYGLLGMRERADAIGALLGIKSRPGRGTLVTLELAAGPATSALAANGAGAPTGVLVPAAPGAPAGSPDQPETAPAGAEAARTVPPISRARLGGDGGRGRFAPDEAGPGWAAPEGLGPGEAGTLEVRQVEVGQGAGPGGAGSLGDR
jgi:signal transduction histidine kinase